MNAAVAQERWQGQIIEGQFALLEWLGGSANTAVFRTELPGSPPLPAAIKLVRADALNPSQQIARWKEAAPSHPNLLRVFHSGHCQIAGAHWLYLVMEYGEENLDQVLPVRALTTHEAGELLPPVVSALSHLHGQGLIHGRIKPSNIFAVKNQLKLSIDSLRPANQTVKPFQASAYDAPEADSGTLSAAADVWSLGMVLVSAFNQRPLSGSRSGQSDPAVPRSVPAPYRLIASECLRINSAERCSLERIKELLQREQPLPKVVVPPAPKRRAVAPVLAVVVLLALIFGLILRHSLGKQAVRTATVQEEPTQTATDQPAVSGDSNSAAQATPPSSGPTVLEQVLPPVPLSARETIHGRVHVNVRVSVDPDGKVSSASFAYSGPSRYFARLALAASRQWRFKPADANGQPAPSRWLLEYRFGRSATTVTPIRER
jgi:TonB family protein